MQKRCCKSFLIIILFSVKDGKDKMQHKTALDDLIKKEYGNTTGIVIEKNGVCIYERYFQGWTEKNTVHVASVTKSVVSVLYGIAAEMGFIKDLDKPVLDYFPDYQIGKRRQNIREITVRNMLTMTAPSRYRTEPYSKFFTCEDWMRFALDSLGGKGKIGDFTYSPIVASHVLSGIFTHATGQSLFDFAATHLFVPLDIPVGRTLVFHSKEEQMAFSKAKDMRGWVADEQGFNTAGWGLTLSPRDMAKIGQLYLNGGTWNGKSVVSPEWIVESTKVQSRWGNLSYGYLWWVIEPQEHSFAALGDGGNVIYVNPKEKLVVAITATFVPKAKDRMSLIKGQIEPMVCDTHGKEEMGPETTYRNVDPSTNK
jgi:CubicO group peptidase (beta-lactamase class C family)